MSAAPASMESFRTLRFGGRGPGRIAPEEISISISTSGDTVSLQSANPTGMFVLLSVLLERIVLPSL